MIIAKSYRELVGDVRGYGHLGDPADAAIAAGSVMASQQASTTSSFWRPILIGTLTATFAWLVTRALESSFGEEDESEEIDVEDEDDEDEPEDDDDEAEE